VAVIFQRESWLARSHVHTKVLQFQSKFRLWLSGLSFDYMSPQMELLKFYNCTTVVLA